MGKVGGYDPYPQTHRVFRIPVQLCPWGSPKLRETRGRRYGTLEEEDGRLVGGRLIGGRLGSTVG